MSDDPVRKRNNAKFIGVAVKAFTPILEDRELFGRETFIKEMNELKDFFNKLGEQIATQGLPRELVEAVKDDYSTIIDAMVVFSDTVHECLERTLNKAEALRGQATSGLLN